MEIGLAASLAIISATAILLVFLGYPALVAVQGLLTKRPPRPERGTGAPPSVTLLVVAHNAAGIIGAKLGNSLELDYPPRRLKILVCSDGSSDRTAAQAGEIADPRISLFAWPGFRGKNQVINDAVAASDSELLVFSDADAMLPPDALRHLTAPFEDPDVGGVCGRKCIAGKPAPLRGAQRRYNAFAGGLKRLESRVGSITANDGKLYAMRRDLFRPLPQAVTDDLFNCLQVVSRGRRFLYEPNALALVPSPSSDAAHELSRRRRIVARSLNGIRIMRHLLNPLRYGRFALGLFVNKVLRRLLPLFLILLFGASLAQAAQSPWMLGFSMLQSAFYATAAFYPLLGGRGIAARMAALPFYFCLGNYASLLGLLDYLRGRRPEKWEPQRRG